MVPTSLPELPKPSRTPGKSEKPELQNPIFYRTIKKHKNQCILTWIYEFDPRNKTIYVVFDEESEFSGPRRPKLRPDQVFEEKRTPEKLRTNKYLSY